MYLIYFERVTEGGRIRISKVRGRRQKLSICVLTHQIVTQSGLDQAETRNKEFLPNLPHE